MSEWKECKLFEVAEKFAMGPFGSNIKAENFIDSGVPVIRGTNLNYYKYVGGNFVFLNEEKATQLKSSNCFPGDLVFTHRGTLGQVGLIPEGKYSRYVISQSGMKLTVKKDILDNQFLFYFFNSSIGRNELLQHEAQVGVPSISNPLTSLKSVNILLPPLPEQKAIAGILSSLDDKIDLLHRQNKTLEGMAEALWRKMFVEDVDESWPEFSLLEIIDLVGGGTPKTEVSEYWDGEIPWLSASDITANHRSFIISTEKSITEKGLNNSSAKIIPSFSTIISARGTVGNYCLLSVPMAFSQSNYGILPKIEGCYFFTYLLVQHVVDELKSAAYGSVFDTITTNTFREKKINLPQENVIIEFEKNIIKYFEKMQGNTQQIHLLSLMRDKLLPKLMSGEVRVKL